MKTKVITCILVGVSLGLFSPQIVSAGKHKGGGGGGGGKAAHAGGGGGGAHMGHQGQHNPGGSNLHSGHGQHGLNAHQGTGHGLNAHNGGRLQARHAAKLSGTHVLGNRRFAARNHIGHWRSGLHWHNY